jgi:CO/xanthine dehydrogenase FAD-binding subunit
VLAVHDATIELVSSGGGRRTVAWNEFLLGPKRTALQPGELILGARWRAVSGPGSFSKIGTRNAMVIAVASLCLLLDPGARAVRVAMGSVGPTVLRATEAEEHAAEALARAGFWEDAAAPVPGEPIEEFGRAVAEAARPIDDIRGSAAYRRHAVEVLARRALAWATADAGKEAA